MLEEFFKIFVSFLVIMDPFASAFYFVGISRNFSEKEKKEAINLATMVAGGTLVFFLLIGPLLLSALGISISSFQIAGGIVLLVISVKFIMGAFGDAEKPGRDTAIMIIGVPLITGPGVLTTTIIMTETYGHATTLSAALAAIAVAWLVLRFSKAIYRVLGKKGMDISSRIMGLLLASVAVEFIKNGILSTLA